MRRAATRRRSTDRSGGEHTALQDFLTWYRLVAATAIARRLGKPWYSAAQVAELGTVICGVPLQLLRRPGNSDANRSNALCR